MHFYESMVITSKDGMQLKSYANEHPDGFVIAKPKYIPQGKITCPGFQKRELRGVKVERFDYWAATPDELATYVDDFHNIYPTYIHNSPLHQRWFFGVPTSDIVEAPDTREGVRKLMKRDPKELDMYLTRVQEFLNVLHDSGLPYSVMGITNSTLLGTYTHGRSDMDILLFGKKNYWHFFDAISQVKHPLLGWKTLQEWQAYYASYNAGLNFTEKEFIWHSQRKRGDGLFGDIVFSVFGVEEPGETAVKWGTETYTPMGHATIKGIVTNDNNSIVRPGFYEIGNSTTITGKDVPVKKVVTFARDFMAQAREGETILANGVLEKVTPQNGNEYYQLVIGYFDSYFANRGVEFIKVKHAETT